MGQKGYLLALEIFGHFGEKQRKNQQNERGIKGTDIKLPDQGPRRGPQTSTTKKRLLKQRRRPWKSLWKASRDLNQKVNQKNMKILLNFRPFDGKNRNICNIISIICFKNDLEIEV